MERLMLEPPALPPLSHVAPQLLARYQAFITASEQDPSLGRPLARDLHAAAVTLSSSRAHELSTDIYWLVQGAATVALLTDGPASDEFKRYEKDVHAYKDGPQTSMQVSWFDRYVASVDKCSRRYVQRGDMDELLSFLPLLYPGGIAIGAVVGWHDGRWPVYAKSVQAFFSAAGKECWTDFNYDITRSGAMLEDPDRVANASLDELKSMLTWCVRGERFCDGHHGSVIEKGYILSLLQRLNVLHQASGYRS